VVAEQMEVEMVGINTMKSALDMSRASP